MPTATTPAAIDYEGGTVRMIAEAPTRNGWAIGVAEWVTYRGDTVYFVARISAGRKFLKVSATHTTEAAARKVANATWKADKAAA